MFYQFKMGFEYPKRSNAIVPMANKVHMFFWRFYPDYNHLMLECLLKNCKEVYVVIDNLNIQKLKMACDALAMR